jgi:hypothetical protein
MGAWRHSSSVLKLGTRREVSGHFHAPVASPPGEMTPRYPLDRRLGGVEKKAWPCQESNPGRQARRYTGSFTVLIIIFTAEFSSNVTGLIQNVWLHMKLVVHEMEQFL